QHGSVLASRKVTPRTSWFFRHTFSVSPTTELPALIGIPFVRVGSRIATARGGLETSLSKRTSITGAYDIQWVGFEDNSLLGRTLLGGHSQGATFVLKHQLSARTAL